MEDSRGEALAAKRFPQKVVRIETGLSVRGAVLYETNVSAVFRRKMALDLSQKMFFSSQGVLKLVKHPVAALYGQNTQWRVQERE